MKHAPMWVLLWLVAAPARADPPERTVPNQPPVVQVVDAIRTAPDGPVWATSNAEAHGRLTLLRVDVECPGSSPRDARRALMRTLGLNLVEYGPRPRDLPASRIDVSLRGVLAIDALQTLIDLDPNASNATWQVRQGIVEVGSRDTLARRTTAETRVIEVDDLLIRAPNVNAPGVPDRSDRRTPRELGAELIEMVIGQVEPDAWHPLSDADRADGLVDPVDSRDPWQGRNLDPRRQHPITGTRAPIYVQGRYASIRLHDGSIVVRAPAFVLHGIEGLPPAVAPPIAMVPTPRSPSAPPQ